MRDTDFSQLLFIHLKERAHNNVYQNLQQDVNYLEAAAEVGELCKPYENPDLSEKQRNVIKSTKIMQHHSLSISQKKSSQNSKKIFIF